MQWIIQNTDSNGGFKCSHSDNLVKYKVWPNNTYKSLHPSQQTWRKTTCALVQVNEHERYVAGKERLAKKIASMAAPSSAVTASSAGDASAGQKPKLKKRKGPDDSSTESAEAADSDPQEIMGFFNDSAPWGWKLIENRIPCHEGMDLPRDGPDRPACIVTWYSAPVAEELCEGYKGVQHARDRAILKGTRWDIPILKDEHGKKLVSPSPNLFVSHCTDVWSTSQVRASLLPSVLSGYMFNLCLTQVHGAQQG